MNNSEMLQLFKNQIISNPDLSKALFEECEFHFDDDIDLNNDILICGEKSNYNITPFGKDTMGGAYCLLNNQYVGYITSEGGCGIIARSVNDFFNLLATCKNLTSYLEVGVFDSFDSFSMEDAEINSEVDGNSTLYEQFINENKFTVDVAKLYEMFKQGIITEPSFILSADPNNYEPWDDLFYTNQQYIKKLSSSESNYLKREDFINSVDKKKIWDKSLNLYQVKELLDFLEKEMSKYNYISDKNFLMDGRRNGLKTSIEERTLNGDENINENVLESLFNLWEFVNNEYYVASLEAQQRLHLKREEMENMCCCNGALKEAQ